MFVTFILLLNLYVSYLALDILLNRVNFKVIVYYALVKSVSFICLFRNYSVIPVLFSYFYYIIYVLLSFSYSLLSMNYVHDLVIMNWRVYLVYSIFASLSIDHSHLMFLSILLLSYN